MPVSEGPRKSSTRLPRTARSDSRLKTSGPSGLIGLMAEADGGARMGLDRSFDRRRAQRNTEPIRIVLKPSRPVTVRVKDATGAPVPGATVEAAEMAFRTHATLGPDGHSDFAHSGRCRGRVGDRVPTSKVGFDYFENYEKRSQTVFRSLARRGVAHA